jgi:hypothetical protein
MADYLVTHVRRNRDGDITALGNLEKKWLHEREDVIAAVRANTDNYYVQWNGKQVKIRAVHHPDQAGDYLRTERDNAIWRDDLEDLPPYPP